MLWDLGTRKVVIKVVFFGPAMAGKTTALRFLFNTFGRDLKSIETQEGRTLFFDWGSLLIQKGQWNFQIDLWSCTGQNFYAETRPTVLSGVDGIVFVADSQSNLLDDNLASWKELTYILDQNPNIPIIIALNKRDFPNAISVNQFKDFFNINNNTAIFETIATQGVNVLEVFKYIVQKIFKNS